MVEAVKKIVLMKPLEKVPFKNNAVLFDTHACIQA